VVLRTRWGFALASLLIVGGIAAAQPAGTAVGNSAVGTPAPAKPSDAPLPSCLDETLAEQLGEQLKPRGVQKKTFLKRHKINLVIHGGMWAGDLTSSSWIAGGSLGVFLTEDFGIAAELDLTPVTLDLDTPLNQFFGDNRFADSMGYLALGNAFWAPIHAKMKIGGGIVHSDIMLFAGAGRLIDDSVQGLAFDAGSALDLFISRFFTVRLDVRDIMAIEEIAGTTRPTNNIVATMGLSVWIPTGL